NGNKADGQARGGLAGQPVAFFVAARVRQHASMFPPAAGNRQYLPPAGGCGRGASAARRLWDVWSRPARAGSPAPAATAPRQRRPPGRSGCKREVTGSIPVAPTTKAILQS